MALRGHASIQGRPTSRPVQSVAGISADAVGGATTPSPITCRAVGPGHRQGYQAYADAYTVSLLAGVVVMRRLRRTTGYDYLPRLNGRRDLPDRREHAGGQGRRLFHHRPEPGRRFRTPASSAWRWPNSSGSWCATSHDRERDPGGGRTGDRVGRTQDRGDQHRGVLPTGRDARTEKAGNFRPNAWSSGGTRRCRRQRRRANWTSTMRLANGSGRGWLVGRSSAIGRILEMTWDYPLNDHGDPSIPSGARRDQRFTSAGPDAGALLSRTRSSGRWLDLGRLLDRRRAPPAASTQAARRNRRAVRLTSRSGDGRPIADPLQLCLRRSAGAIRGVNARSTWWTSTAVAGPATTFRLPTSGPFGHPAPVVRSAPRWRVVAAHQRSPMRRGCFARSGLVDGPLPTHYEAQESPVRMRCIRSSRRRPAMLSARDNWTRPAPAIRGWRCIRTSSRPIGYRAPHAGRMSRWSPYLANCIRKCSVRITGLAAEVGVVNEGWRRSSARGRRSRRVVLVTDRLRPLDINGRAVHQVGLPYHWGRAATLSSPVTRRTT